LVSRAVGRVIERDGLLECDTEQLDPMEALDADDPMFDLAGHCIICRVVVGPHRGRKVFTLQAWLDSERQEGSACAPGKVGGFSWHAGVAIRPHQRGQL